MSQPGRNRIPLALSESLDDEEECVPPPSYDEVIGRGLVSSVLEPPALSRGERDNAQLDALLSVVRDQRLDLDEELGRKSEERNDQSMEPAATPGGARGDATSETDQEKGEEPKSNMDDEGELEDTVGGDGSSSEDEPDDFNRDKNKKERTEGTRMLDVPVEPGMVQIEEDRDDDDEIRHGQRNNDFHKDLPKRRQDEKRDKDDDSEEIEMMPINVYCEEDADNISLPEITMRRRSFLAVEDDNNSLRYSPRGSIEQMEIDEPDAERGRRRRRNSRDSEEWDCGPMPLPFVREIANFVVHRIDHVRQRWPGWSTQKRLILVFSVLFVIGLVLLVSLLPASFVYVDYDKMGFVHNRLTGKIDYDRVYDYGCYLMAPQHSMVLFSATAHFLDLRPWVFDQGGLSIRLDIYIQYFLRPGELSQLYKKYHDDYRKVIERLAESTVKNLAPKFSLDEFRLNRSMVEVELFNKLRYALSGDCCDTYKNDRFSSKFALKECNSSKSCYHGSHIDVAYFQFGAVQIPHEVLNRYIRQVVLEMETEREFYIQEAAVQRKLTTLSVQKILNQVKETTEEAHAKSRVIKRTAEASAFRVKEKIYLDTMKKVYGQLNITGEKEKTSLMFLQTLKNAKENLIAFSYNYGQETLYSP